MARREIERDVRLALERCEQMLARVREQRLAPGEARDRDAERLGENTERLLEDLAPRAGRRGRSSNEQRP